jgi:hypothetical protein
MRTEASVASTTAIAGGIAGVAAAVVSAASPTVPPR